MYEIPIFPLNTVLFPGMPLHLHIFEERYKTMLKDVLAGDSRFGVVLIKNGIEALGPLPQPHLIGCTARITHVDPLTDGRINLTAVGENRFKIARLLFSRPYLVGSVDNFPIETALTSEEERKASLLRVKIKAYLQLIADINRSTELDIDSALLPQLELSKDPNTTLLLACGLLHLPAAEKQPILELASSKEILSYLLRIYNRELSVYGALMNTSEEEARQSAWLN